MKHRHLILAPHPDDEMIGCGGALIKARQRGDECKVVILCTKDINGNLLKDRERESSHILNFLGINDIVFFREQERSLRYDLEIVKKVLAEIDNFKPTMFYYPHSNEKDRDHAVVNEIAQQVSIICSNKEIRFRSLQYEIWTPLEAYHQIVDISDVLEKKKDLLKLYKSQADKFNEFKGQIGLNMYRGMQNGIYAAEAYG